MARFLLGVVGLASAAGLVALALDRESPAVVAAPADITIGLFTSLPIMWAEDADVGSMLTDKAPPHWALSVLRGKHGTQPLDVLQPIPAGIDLLVLAQPRPLSPPENVALDAWVRGGGKVLLFADPMLTRESMFAPGDPRRPQDIAMLSPILTRWGLSLAFDEDQPVGTREVGLWGDRLPVNLPGQFTITDAKACSALADGLVARCRIGRGAVLAVADAAMLEPAEGEAATMRAAMLANLLAKAR
ncbi:MAG: ABC transporter [Novosphingobium sp.]